MSKTASNLLCTSVCESLAYSFTVGEIYKSQPSFTFDADREIDVIAPDDTEWHLNKHLEIYGYEGTKFEEVSQ